MSVLVTAIFPGDSHAFRASLHQRASEYEAWAERGQAAGAIHHRFAITGESVMVADEWDSAEHFNAFMDNPDLQKFISEIGASGPPQVFIAEAIDSPDRF